MGFFTGGNFENRCELGAVDPNDLVMRTSSLLRVLHINDEFDQ